MHEFQNYEQLLFRPIITTDKKNVECQYTNYITWSETCFDASFVRDRLYIKGQNNTSFCCSKSGL